jgi:hypothetical protein
LQVKSHSKRGKRAKLEKEEASSLSTEPITEDHLHEWYQNLNMVTSSSSSIPSSPVSEPSTPMKTTRLTRNRAKQKARDEDSVVSDVLKRQRLEPPPHQETMEEPINELPVPPASNVVPSSTISRADRDMILSHINMPCMASEYFATVEFCTVSDLDRTAFRRLSREPFDDVSVGFTFGQMIELVQ